MEVTELTLWIARLLVLVLMYGFLLALICAVLADARAHSAPRALSPARRTSPTPAAPAAAPEMAAPTLSQLTVIAGTVPTTGRLYPLVGPLEFGRVPECGVILPNRFVSSRHARIYPVDGQWCVEDLGSTNGTLLNGEPLLTPQPLLPGDQLIIGDTTFLAE